MGTVVVLVVVVIGGLWIFFKVRRSQRIQSLRNAYDEALRGTDKQRALAAGRAYYSALRGTTTEGGLLTTYDEAAIANDISAMKV